MAKNDNAAHWVEQALAAFSEPEQVSKAEIGLAVNKVEKAIEGLEDNPAPGEYETLVDELKRSNPDGNRCRQSLQTIHDRIKAN